MSEFLVPVRRPESDLFVRTDYKIIFQDSNLLVVSKPSPLPAHACGIFREKNLLTILSKDLALDTTLHVVNRLDSETSGLIVVAKGKVAAGKLGKQFENQMISKTYRAIVLGLFDQPSGEINFPLGWEIAFDARRRCHDENGQSALTRYQVLDQKRGMSLVELKPVTGRTHQLRIHMAIAGHPMIGDKLYIDPEIHFKYRETGWLEEMKKTVFLNRLALHANALSFFHPETGERLNFESEFPEDLKDFWNGPEDFILQQ